MLLLNNGADINAVDIRNDAALHQALNNRQHDLALLLIDKGAAVASAGRYGTTPLHWAAAMGFPDIIARLVQRGADLEVETAQDKLRWPLQSNETSSPRRTSFSARGDPIGPYPAEALTARAWLADQLNEVAALEGEHGRLEKEDVLTAFNNATGSSVGPLRPETQARVWAEVRRRLEETEGVDLVAVGRAFFSSPATGGEGPIDNEIAAKYVSTAWPTRTSPARTKWPLASRW